MRRAIRLWSTTLAQLGSRKKQRRKRHRNHRWPSLEYLESRLMLSITVNTLIDENNGVSVGNISLRDAIAAASTGETINFHSSLAGGTIELDHGALVLDDDIFIVGIGADRLTIDADNSSAVFVINSGVAVTLHGLKITGGSATRAGGIDSEGILTLDESHVTGNTSTNVGGIRQEGGELTILNSTISDNVASVASGGIATFDDAVVEIFHSTISGNAGGSGTGGVHLNLSSGTAKIAHSTVSDNDGNTAGGISTVVDFTVTLRSTIVAGNTSGSGAKDVAGDFDSSSAYNLIGVINGSTGLDDITTQYGTTSSALDAGLAPLGNYGGRTPTHALLEGSVAVDAGDPSIIAGLGGVPNFDQRAEGFTRVFDDVIDIGAYEANAATAEVLFVVDESGSMATEHAWIDAAALKLEEALATKGIAAVRFGLTGFGGASGTFGRKIMVGGREFGTATQFTTATNSLVVNGGTEDGYAGINFALNNYKFRAKAQVNIILVTDEDRDYATGRDLTGDTNPGNDDEYLLAELTDHRAILNVLVDARFDGATVDPEDVIGVLNAQGHYLAADGAGGFDLLTDATSVGFTDFGTTFEDYIQPAWSSFGATWDLNIIREGNPLRTQSFTAAFAEIKAEEIANPNVILIENTDFVVDYRQEITLGEGANALQFQFANLTFDTSDLNAINDAFEFALVDQDGNSVVATIGHGRDAFFNLTEGEQPKLAAGVAYEPEFGTVSVDVSHLPAGTVLTLVARLVNNDGLPDDSDTTTQVLVVPGVLELSEAPESPAQPPPGGSAAPVAPRDTELLVDVTAGFDVDYKITSYNADNQTLLVSLSLTNNGLFDVRDNLLIGLRHPSRPVQLLGTDGVLPNGLAYYNLSGAAFDAIDGFNRESDVVTEIELEIYNPYTDRFDYDLVILGHVNHAPEFTSQPRFADTLQRIVEAPISTTGGFSAAAVDLEGDVISYSLLSHPDWLTIDGNEVAWSPQSGDEGVAFPVIVRATDEHGAYTDLTFNIRAVDIAQNRAPSFETTPEVTAFVDTLYDYKPLAFDPDGDEPLFYSLGANASEELGANGDDFSVNQSTGQITWTPTAEQVDKTFHVHIEVYDRETDGLKDDLEFDIRVFQQQGNHDPYFTSQPGSESDPLSVDHYVVEPPATSPDDVTPDTITLSLDGGEAHSQTISVDLDEDALSADIVFVLDVSSSMANARQWLQHMVTEFDAQLVERGITNNRYGLVLFSTTSPTLVTFSGRKFTSAAAIAGSTGGGVGGTADGYQGIAFALQKFTTTVGGENPADEFRADAARTMVLITDAGREGDYYNPSPNSYSGNPNSDFLNLRDRLDAEGVRLDVVVASYFAVDDGAGNLGQFQVGNFTPGNGAPDRDTIVGNWGLTADNSAYRGQSLAPGVPAVSTIAVDGGEFESILGRGQFTINADLRIQGNPAPISPLNDLNTLPPHAFVVFDYKSPTDFNWAGITAGSKWLKFGRYNGTTWTTDSAYNLSTSTQLGIASVGVGQTLNLQFDVYGPLSPSASALIINGVAIDFDGGPSYFLLSGLTNSVTNDYRVGVGAYQANFGEEVFAEFESFTLVGNRTWKGGWGPSGQVESANVFGASGGVAALGIDAITDSSGPMTGYIPTLEGGNTFVRVPSTASDWTAFGDGLEVSQSNASSIGGQRWALSEAFDGGIGKIRTVNPVAMEPGRHDIYLRYYEGNQQTAGQRLKIGSTEIPIPIKGTSYTSNYDKMFTIDGTPYEFKWVGYYYSDGSSKTIEVWSPWETSGVLYFDELLLVGPTSGSFEERSGGFHRHELAQKWDVNYWDGTNEVGGPDIEPDTLNAFMTLAWDTGGSAWDINYLRGTNGTNSRNPALQSFTGAFVASRVDDIFERLVAVRSDDPVLQGATFVGVSEPTSGVKRFEFEAQFLGDGNPHPAFDVEFVNPANNLAVWGTIPTTVNASYVYQLAAADPDGDVPLAFAFAPGSETYGASLDGNVLRWDAAAQYWEDADPGDPQPINYSFDLVVSDGRGGQGFQQITITVELPPTETNSQPEFDLTDFVSGPNGSQRIVDLLPDDIEDPLPRELRRFNFALSATDEDADDRLRYYLVEKPAPGMTIDRNTGVISWEPGNEHVGDQYFTVRVVDGRGGEDAQTFVIEVQERDRINHLPTIIPVGSDEEIVAGTLYAPRFEFFDIDGDSASFSLLGGPDGMAIDQATGELRWQTTVAHIGTHDFVIGVTDAQGETATQRFQVQVLTPNQPPRLVTPLPSVAQRGHTYRVAIQAFDPESGAPASVPTSQPGLPTGMQVVQVPYVTYDGQPFNKSFLEWNFDTLDASVSGYLVLEDAEELAAEIPFQFEIVDVDHSLPVNQAPVITEVPSRLVVGQPFLFHLDVIDPDNDPMIMDFSFNNAPDETWLDVEFDGIGEQGLRYPVVMSGIPDQESVGLTFTLTVLVDDDGDTQTWETEKLLTFTVVAQGDNRAPVIEQGSIPAAVVGRPYRLPLKASDADRDSLKWSLDSRPDSSMAIDPNTGVLTWVPEERHLGVQEVIVRATDLLGASHAISISLPVRGTNTPPSLPNFNPPRYALQGGTYNYQVEMLDIDGGISEPRYTFEGSLPSWVQAGDIDAKTGLISINVSPSAPLDEYTIGVKVSNGSNSTDSVIEYFTVTVTDDADLINELPQFKNAPLFDAYLGQQYQFVPQVIDAESGPLSPGDIALGLGSASGMSYNSLTGVVTWDTDSLPGNQYYLMVLQATDPVSGEVVEQRTPIYLDGTVGGGNPNSLPQFEALPADDEMVRPGSFFQRPAFAFDADGDPLFFKLIQAPAGMTIDRFGVISWHVPDDHPTVSPGNEVPVEVIVRDRFGEAAALTYSFTLTVEADETAPEVFLGSSLNVAPIGTSIDFDVAARDESGIYDVELWASDGTNPDILIPINASGRARYTFATPGTYTILATATDGSEAANQGNSNAITVVVYDPALVEAPEVTINDWPQETTIEDVVEFDFDVAFDAPVGTVTYRLELVQQGGREPMLLSEGTGTASEVPVTIDPFQLSDGAYQLRLKAQVNGMSGLWDLETRDFIVDTGNFKLGNLQLSFTDLTVSLGGLPFTFSRSYDTTRTNIDSNLGPGWRLDTIANAEISIEGGVSLAPDPDYRVDETYPGLTRGSKIFVTLPGGRTEGWEFNPIRQGGMLLPDGRTLYTVRANFDPLPGTTSKLVDPFIYVTEYVTLEGDPGEWSSFELYSGNVYAQPYSLFRGDAKLTLTTAAGFKYNIAAIGGIIRDITDPQGNQIAIKNGSITATDAAGNRLGSVLVQRDAGHNNRITRIQVLDDLSTTPVYDNGVLTNGQEVVYGYDPVTGDLISVTDRAGRETTYVYGEAELDHFLTQVVDADGVPTLTAQFDEVTGRLSGLIDAEGNPAAFSYALEQTGPHSESLKVEVVEDAFGHPVELARDFSGRLVRRVEWLDEGATGSSADDTVRVTVFHYEGSYLVGESKPFERTYATRYSLEANEPDLVTIDPAEWLARSKYDGRGNLLEVQDGLGNTTHYLGYTSFGKPTEVIDPQGGRTINTYNAQNGRLERSVAKNAVGETLSDTVYTYEERFGALTRIELVKQRNTAGHVVDSITISENDYDNLGRLIRTADAAGNEKFFAYDVAGNQVLSFHYWDDPATGNGSVGDGTPDKLVVSRTDYDAEGRVIQSRQYLLGETFAQFGFDVDDKPLLTSAAQLNGETPLETTSTDYDNAGRSIAHTDRYGNETLSRYDARGNLVETRTLVLGADGVTEFWQVSRTAYDDNGRVVAATDPFLLTSDGDEYYVDPATEVPLTSGTPVFLRATHTVYDVLGRAIETRRLKGAAAEIQLAANGTYTGKWTTTFDESYDDLVDWEATFDELLSRTQTYYDLEGLVWKTVANEGTADELTTWFLYDEAGRQTHVSQAIDLKGDGLDVDTSGPNGIPLTGDDVLLTRTLYDSAGRVQQTIDPAGRITQFRYDGAGRVIAKIFDDFTETRTEYDLLGRRVAEIDPQGKRTEFQYDDLGRLIEVRPPEVTSGTTGSTTGEAKYQYEYDIYGNQVLIRDPMDDDLAGTANKETSFTFDHFGRQITRTLPAGQIETAEYNDTPLADLTTPASSVGAGQLEYQVDFEGRVTAYRYDNTALGGGRLVGKYYYAELSDYTTDAGDGTLTTAVESVVYSYDAFGRQIEVDDSAHGVTATTYDADGRVTSVTSPEGTVRYEYDALGRLTRTYTGDADTNGTSDASDDEEVTDVRYTYDSLGRLKTVQVIERNDAPVTEDATQYRYDQVGNLDQVESPSGVIADHDYDALNRLQRLRHFDDDGDNVYESGVDAVLAQYDYTVRADGKRTRVVELDDQGRRTQIDWVYDELGRLTEERYNSYDNTLDAITRFGFDLASNRILKTVDKAGDGDIDETTTYTHDANDRLLTEELNNDADVAIERTTTYQYGGPTHPGTQQTRKTVTGDISETHVFEYDQRGRLAETTVTKSGTTTVSQYVYDDSGVRMKQTVTVGAGTPVVTEYLIDPQNHTGYAKAIEEHVDGALARSYAIGHQIISQSNFTGSPATHFFIHDGHGSTRMLVSSAASVVQRYAYDAHGETLSGTGLTTAASANTTWLFAGDGQYDRANGLTNHIARWRQGHRFLSLDPYAGNTSDPLSLHKYLYGQGNPILYTDPSGLFGLAGLTTGFSIANSLRNLDIQKNLLVFDLTNSLIAGSQAGYSDTRIFGGFLLNQTLGFGLGFAIGSANNWIRNFLALRGASWFDDVARAATRNADSGTLVLGHFATGGSSYQRVAAHYRATYFKLDDWRAVTQGLSQDEIWRINEAFLDQQVAQGKKILFSHNPFEARLDSFFEREVDYLRELGYNFRQKNQWTWEAVL